MENSLMDYFQPSFYHFNDDSIHLVKLAKQKLRKCSYDRVLDLGAGCGILGYELSNSISIKELHFVEFQDEFIPFIEQNKCFGKVENITTHLTSFADFHSTKKFDLIISNPPFYLKSNSRSSNDVKRNICRRFEIDSLEEWFDCLKKNLAPTGEVFFVVDENHSNKLNIFKIDKFEVKLETKIKNTLFYRIFPLDI